MPETNTQNTTDSQSSNTDSSRRAVSMSSTANRPRLRWPLAVLLMVVVVAGLLKLYTDWEISRLEQEQQQAQQELQRQASIQKLLVGTLSADRIEADEGDFETLRVSGQATIEELMARTADIEDLRAENLAANEGHFNTLLMEGARIADNFRVNGDTTLADLLLKGQLRLTGNTEDMVLLEPGGSGQSVFSVRTPSGEETARLNAGGDLRLTGDADIGGVLRVSRNAAFNADVLVKGGLLVQESVQLQDSLAVGKNTTLSGSLTVKDSARLRESLSVQGPLEVGEDATFKSGVRMEQNLDVQGQLTAGTAVSTGTTDLQGAIFNTSSNNQGRVYVDDDFEVTGTMYGTDLVMSGSVTQGNTTVNNLTVLGTADFLGPVTMNDELTIGPNTLYADPVNNRVGIGTDTPSQLLHVAGNALVDNDLTVSGFASITNNLEVGGNLTVSGTGAFTGTVSGSDAAANDEFVTLGQINDGGDTSTSAFVQGGNSFGALAALGTNDNQDLRFITNNIEAMRVLANGNVGIGTASPLVSLQVSGGFFGVGY